MTGDGGSPRCWPTSCPPFNLCAAFSGRGKGTRAASYSSDQGEKSSVAPSGPLMKVAQETILPKNGTDSNGAAFASSSNSVFGHAGNKAKGEYFYKLKPSGADRFENERRLLELLVARRREGDPMTPYAPEYHGLVEIEGQQYFQMQHLLRQFEGPNIMDIKMGVRCYTESELLITKPRNDLFKKMVRMRSDLLTPEEMEAQAITKARWMMLRDCISSTQTLGFRVDAMMASDMHKTAFNSDLFRIREESEVVDVLRSFLPRTAECEGCTPRSITAALIKRLEDIHEGLCRSEVFAQHEFIGSTLLFVADKCGRSSVWMIDFGVTVPSESRLKHDVPWELGNHEDGYLTGLRNLIRIWRRLLAEDSWK